MPKERECQSNGTLREASAEDVSLVASMVRAAYKDLGERLKLTDANCPYHPCCCEPGWIEDELAAGYKYFVYELDGLPCGCFGLATTGVDSCRVEKLAVLPEFRRKGIGTRLMEHAFALARKLRVSQIEVSLLQKNEELRAWYEGHGFTLSGTVRYPHIPFATGFLFAEV